MGERFGTSGFHAEAPSPIYHGDALDPAARSVFLEHELRSRRFFGLGNIAIWEQDSIKWKQQSKAVRKESRLAPFRPSYLPFDHLSTECAQKPCRDGCLG